MNSKLSQINFKFDTEMFRYPQGSDSNLDLLDDEEDEEDPMIGYEFENIGKGI